jgi:hypothetical protein
MSPRQMLFTAYMCLARHVTAHKIVERTAFVRAWPCLPVRAHVCLFPYSTLLIIFSLWICIPKQSYHTL